MRDGLDFAVSPTVYSPSPFPQIGVELRPKRLSNGVGDSQHVLAEIDTQLYLGSEKNRKFRSPTP